MEQRIAVLVSAVLGAFLLGLFAAIARSAKSPASAEDIAVAGARGIVDNAAHASAR